MPLCSAVVCPVMAQNNEDPEQQIEVVQVRAQKRVQNIEDLTFSISYLSGLEIRERLLKDTTALSSAAPNFKITQNAAEGTPPSVNIRGVGSVDYNTSTVSPVGIYVNGAASGSANNQLVNLFDIESVEVLRGPQGTLFGRNTTAGAVLINTKRPQQEVSGYIDVAAGERNFYSLEGAVNTELSDNTSARLAFSQVSYDYSTNNLYAPAPQADMRQSNVRASLLSEFGNAEILAIAHYGEWSGIVNPVGNIGVIAGFDPATGLPNAFCTPAQAGSSICTDAFGFNDGSEDFYDVAVNTDVSNDSPHDSEYWDLYLEGRYNLNDKAYLVSVTSVDTLDRVHFFNSDGSPAQIAEGNQDVVTDTFSQEFRYHLDEENFYLIAGLYYLSNSIEQDNRFDFLRDFRAVPALFSNAATFFYDNEIETESYAAFGQLEYQLSTKSSLLFGLRFTDETIEYQAIGDVNIALAAGDFEGFVVPAWNVEDNIEDSNWSGKLAYNYAVSNDTKLFASFARGFKSGGYNGALVNSAEAAEENDYGAETLNAYELGVTSTALQNTRIQAALFYYDYNDQQVFMNQESRVPGGLPLQLLSNVGESEIYGAELELSSQLTSALQAQFSIGYLPEANLDSFVNSVGEEITDNRLPFTSEWNIAAAIDYTLTVADGELRLHLDVDYQSDFYFDQNQNPYAQQDSFALWNARISYTLDDWTVAIWSKNITDEEYSNLKFDLINAFGMLQDFKGEARQLGASLSYEF